MAVLKSVWCLKSCVNRRLLTFLYVFCLSSKDTMAVLKSVWCLKSCVNRMLLTHLYVFCLSSKDTMAVLKSVWCLKSCVNRMLLTPLRILSFFKGYHGCAQKCLVFEIVCKSYVTHSLTYFVFLQRIPWLCSKVFGV